MNKTTVVYHSADFDGIFCREIAKKFIPDADFIGWDYGDPLLKFPEDGTVYLMDLSPDCFASFVNAGPAMIERLVWIDHHKSAIEGAIGKYSAVIPGYRIDGVAACRLTYQWFTRGHNPSDDAVATFQLPTKEEFIHRKVSEPYAVRLAGEYDIFDKRDPDAELFQHGLRTRNIDTAMWGDTPYWTIILSNLIEAKALVNDLLVSGRYLQYAREQEYKEVITQQGFDATFEGYTYLACNSHELDIRSQLFEAGIKPHHDGLLGFTWTGKDWRVSLYGVRGPVGIDHSLIAVKHGGGGHINACGFRAKTLTIETFPAPAISLITCS